MSNDRQAEELAAWMAAWNIFPRNPIPETICLLNALRRGDPLEEQTEAMNSYLPLRTGSKRFLPLILVCLILCAPRVRSEDKAPYRTGLPGLFPSACHAALLLTPEQNASLQEAWKTRDQEMQKIRESGSKLTLEQKQAIRSADKEFDRKCSEVLTPAQRDTILLINDVYKSVSKTIAADYQQQIDANFAKQEKKSSMKERSRALSAAFENELKAVLPAERFAAFKAALVEQ